MFCCAQDMRINEIIKKESFYLGIHNSNTYLTTKIYKDFYLCYLILIISSVQFSRSVISDSLRPHEPQNTRPPCPSPTPGVYPNSCPLSRWCHLTISSSVIPFSSCLKSFQYQGLFKWVSSLYQVPKILEFQLQHQSSSHFWVPGLSRTPWWLLCLHCFTYSQNFSKMLSGFYRQGKLSQWCKLTAWDQ